jgi:hypothetical protein
MIKKNIKTIILFFVALFVIYLTWLSLGPIKNIYVVGQKIPEAINEINSYIQNNDYISANIYINQTEDNIAIIRENLQYISFLKVVPIWGNRLKQIENTLIDAQLVCFNSSELINSLTEFKDVDQKFLISKLGEYPEEIQKLMKSLSSLLKNVNLLTNIFKINDNKSIDSISFISKLLEIIQPIESHLFEILGYNGQQRYLLLFQNNTELRPTGGFIGTYGILEISDGKISNLFIDDIYHLDSKVIGKLNNKVPAPLKKYLKMEEWYMRDCNWNPDFPSTAQDCLNLYKIESEDEKEINGIITLTPDIIAKIFKIIGAQEVGGVLFESNNFTSDLQKAVELYYKERGATHWERKDIISSLAEVIIDRFQYLDFKEYGEVIDVISKGLKTKDILVYSENPSLQNLFLQSNWTGQIINVDSDYLMIVDSNLASFKSDQYMERDVNYQLRQNENNELIATLILKYQHHGSFSWNSTRYRTYTRVLVPQGSELIEVIGAMDNDRSTKKGQVDVYLEYNKQIFGAFIAIEPGQNNSLIFKYKLPENIKEQINEKKYEIYLQKQPGVKNVQYLFNIDFQENFSNYQTNIDEIIENNLSSFKGKIMLNEDYLININW